MQKKAAVISVHQANCSQCPQRGLQLAEAQAMPRNPQAYIKGFRSVEKHTRSSIKLQRQQI
jgi:hypothetical protein